MSKGLRIVIAITIVIVGGIIFAFTYQGSTEPIEKVADQLKVDPSWKIESETIEPPRIICLGDNACPSLHKIWNPGKYMTKVELEDVLRKSHWNLPVRGSCEPSPDTIGMGTVCTARGQIDNYDVSMVVRASQENSRETQLILLIN